MLPVLGVRLWLQVRQLAQIVLEEVGEEDVGAEPQAGGLDAPGEDRRSASPGRKTRTWGLSPPARALGWEGRPRTAAARTPDRGASAPGSPAAHFGGEGRGWVLQRPVGRRSTLSGPAPPAPLGLAAGAPHTWWRGWRRRTRPTGGGGRPRRRRPRPRRCGSAARCLPSGSAPAPPGPSGSRSGPGGPRHASWGRQAASACVLASGTCCHLKAPPQCRAPPPRPKHQSFLDGSWFSATPACLSGSPVPGGGRQHRPLTPRERGCAAHGPQRDARPAAVGWPACLPCRGRCQRRARPLTRSPAREPGSVVPVLTLARRLVGGLAGRPPRFPHSRLMRPPEAPAPPPGAGGFLPGAARRLWGAGCWLRARLQCRGPETAAWLDAQVGSAPELGVHPASVHPGVLRVRLWG